MDDLLKEFFAECYENLEQLDREFIELENEPDDRQRLASIFRKVHTIKGSAGFLGFSKLESLAHAGENLLSLLRTEKLDLDQDKANALLAMVDGIRRILAAIESSGSEGEEDHTPLIAILNHFQQDVPLEECTKPPLLPTSRQENVEASDGHIVSTIHPSAEIPSIIDEKSYPSAQSETFRASIPLVEAKPAISDPGQCNSSSTERKTPIFNAEHDRKQRFEQRVNSSSELPMGQILIAEGYVTQRQIDDALVQQNLGDPRRIGEILIERGDVKPSTVREILERKGSDKTGRTFIPDTTIRVNVGVLDQLMNLAGELVLARNQILQYALNQAEDSNLTAAAQRLGLHITELQERVMKARMQPIRTVLNQLHRLVRDLEKACGKQVRIEMAGEETELDRTLIEAIKDPLTHIVRNAIDHGIELPTERIKRGKPAEGRIVLIAFHKGSQVHLEIFDDGAGIDPAKIKQRAVTLNLITREQAEQLSEAEIIRLVFLPGFSTTEKVTNISGRGVGMDVLKTNIERIGGTIDVQSSLGQGTTIRLKIPLTLAIIPVLLVANAGYRYAIPKMNLIELVLLKGEEAQKGIEFIHNTPVYRLRGKLLPLVYLRSVLKTVHQLDKTEAQTNTQTTNIVILQSDDRQFGLVVDQIYDTEEIVVKAFGKLLKRIPVFAGATVMGDGTIALILDVVGIAQTVGVVSNLRDKLSMDTTSTNTLADGEEEHREELLLVRTPDNGRLGIPLSAVARLERLPSSSIEYVGNQEVIQYRNQILPLIRVNHLLQERRHQPRDTIRNDNNEVMHVVVCGSGIQLQGLVVEQILDIIETAITVKNPPTRKGILFTSIIQGRVTEFLDIDALTSYQTSGKRGNKRKQHKVVHG